ncbi:protein SIEVE ELEMENT OCCLUSION B-like [Momordica charantia]|uniref:Protein SIEVE ELEMENT OCCLUSION B-like n=1 Tax=Momordica charantia TaxID=3673 RepID=A0A6J1BZ70_MOMCH|nr:protein SIEVE ELEMENT OCCLUSION B-like [Momordica charantia]
MAAHTRPAPKMHQLIKSDRRMFSASDDNAMTKQVLATHAPDGREVDVKPILLMVEDIIRRATPDIRKVLDGSDQHMEMLEEQISSAEMDGMLESLAHVIEKVGSKLACKCSGGDAHATTMAILNLLSNYSWDAKVVITMAAFAVSYGQYWLLAQLYTTNLLAKALALLKQLPDVIEHSNSVRPQFDALNKLIQAMLNVTKCIVEFTELPSQYISHDTPAMSVAIAHFPAAAYWTIKSVVACMSLIESLVGLSHERIMSTTEVWELSSLAHKETNIHEHLQTQLDLCLQHIGEKANKVDLQMAYVGKNNAKERVRKLTIMIGDNKLSHCWPDSTLVWFFWARLESMMYSKLKYGKTVENDQIMQEIMTLLSFDGSDKGWAIFFGRGGEMTRAKGETALSCILAFDKWKEEAEERGFLRALAEYLQQLRTPHHCNRLILPGVAGNIPENVVCAECGRAMEKYLMYRCCVE